MKALVAKDLIPVGYIYQPTPDKKITFPNIEGQYPVLHMKTFNPLNEIYGMSPIEAASYGIDIHNDANVWNHGLIKNSAVPSGALEFDSNLTDEQYLRLKKEVVEQYQGSRNAGRPALLESGLKWKQMAFSPSDMDWLNSKHSSARDISNVFKYPSFLLGIPGDNRHSNMEEAKLSLYENTVLPLAKKIKENLNRWLLPKYPDGENLFLDYDEDKIDAMFPKREKKWKAINEASFLTINEKREAVGYEAIDGGDVLQLELQRRFTSQSNGNQEQPEIDEDDKKTKAIDLQNDSAKRKYFRSVNERRDALQKKYEKEFRAIFTKQAKDIQSSIQDVSNEVAQFAAVNALYDSRPQFIKSLQKLYEVTFKEFGADVLRLIKSMNSMEYKDAEDIYTISTIEWIDEHLDERTDMVFSTSEKQLTKTIKENLKEGIEQGWNSSEIAKAISEQFINITRKRAELISRTEVGIASNEGQRRAAKATKLNLVKEWVAAMDDRTRDPHQEMNGVKVKMDEKFLVPSKDGPDLMDGPQDASAPADQTINCRCTLVYSRM
jgi:hypothetical protein